jgi:hypothetical protein
MRSQCGVNPARGILLHAWDQVRIHIERDRDAGVPSPLTRDLGWTPAASKWLRCECRRS